MTKYDKSRSWAAMYDYEVRIHIRISLLICLISYNSAFNLSEDATAENKIIRRATQVLMTSELTIEACNKAGIKDTKFALNNGARRLRNQAFSSAFSSDGFQISVYFRCEMMKMEREFQTY